MMKRVCTYHRYICFLCLFACMAASMKAADSDVLERVIYLSKNKGTVYALLGKVSEQCGFLFIYDSKVVDNERTVKLGAGRRTIRQAVYEIIGRQDISLRIVGNHILINQLQVQRPVIATPPDTLAYFTLEGKLQDNQSGTPIAYGTVGVVGTSTGTITNQDGEFRLRLPDSLRQSRIGVSHVGYVGQEMDIPLLEAQHAVWSLEPKVIPIQEVVIRAVNPVRLLREMLNAKKVNYAPAPVYLTTFYREGVQYKQKFRSLTEAVFKIYKPSPLLIHSQDHVKLLKMSNITNSEERDTLIAKMSAGIDACLQLDIIKNLPDFLLPDDRSNVYTYSSCDMTVIDNRLVNVISFQQNKGVKEPLYCGELYIDAENNALVQARLEIHPSYIKQATDMFVERKARKWKITAQKVVYTISYKQWNGIYYMNHIRGDLYFKVKQKRQWFSSSALHTWFEMVTCKVDTDNVVRFQRKERIPTRTIFSDTHYKYDADFWGDFNVIPWEEELNTVIEKLSSKIERIEY